MEPVDSTKCKTPSQERGLHNLPGVERATALFVILILFVLVDPMGAGKALLASTVSILPPNHTFPNTTVCGVIGIGCPLIS